MEDPSPISGAIETVAKRLVRPIPIASAIETLADRLGATNEQAWAEIKSKAFYGRLSMAGIDNMGRLCDLEPHWISYIEPWLTEDPSPACASASIGGPTPLVRQHPVTSDMPRDNSGSIIAFDRSRAIWDWRADKSDGRVPRSIPPLRIRDVVTDGAQLDDLWARAEYEFQNLDWSLGNVLSWIAFRDPLLICKFESRRNLAAKRLYDFPRSGPLGRPMVVPLADRNLFDALKEGTVTAIRNGAEIPSAFWFGKQTTDLKVDLRFRRTEVISRWPADINEQAIVSSRTANGVEMSEEDHGQARKWQREEWRRDWIVRFAERQRTARWWISFVELADWGAHSTTAASADAEDRARELVYRRLSESMLIGAFEQEGRSKILYLDPHVTLDGASPRCRLTREQFEIAVGAAAMPPAASLPLIVLGRCWLPRELARYWLESHGYRGAPHFAPVQDNPAPEGADRPAVPCNRAVGQHATNQAADDEWVRLQDGEGFIGEIWPESSAQERCEAVIAILFAGEVSKWARLEGASPPERDISDLLAGGDRRNVTIDIPNSRIVLQGFRIRTDRPLLPLWPGGPAKLPEGEDTKWELGKVRFAREPGRAYAAEKLFPRKPVPFMPTGAPGRPSKGMHVMRIEFDRRRIANECKPSLREEAAELEGWFRNRHPTAQPMKRKTIENNIRSDYRDWAADRRSG